MSMNDDKLETLIGKQLDGEITLAEQRWLDEELARNAEARELFEQLRTLTECGRLAVASEVLAKGSGPEEVLQQLRQRHRRSPWRRIMRADGHLHFAAGLAAGFLLGVLLHFVLVSNDAGAGRQAAPTGAARDYASFDTLAAEGHQDAALNDPRLVMRNVDWVSFTDRTGQQWLIEGVREGAVRSVVYDGDL